MRAMHHKRVDVGEPSLLAGEKGEYSAAVVTPSNAINHDMAPSSPKYAERHRHH